MIFQEGQVIADGRYRIESFIAHGGMAEVWRVIHTQSGEVHALKILTTKSLFKTVSFCSAENRRNT